MSGKHVLVIGVGSIAIVLSGVLFHKWFEIEYWKQQRELEYQKTRIKIERPKEQSHTPGRQP